LGSAFASSNACAAGPGAGAIFDVRGFRATGKRGDNATGPVRAAAGCSTFIRVKGDTGSGITLKNNATRKAKQPVTFENKKIQKTVRSAD